MTDTSVNGLGEAREAFIQQWGAIGTAWGISRTMALVHALFLASPEPLHTDDVMERLQVSRGNAHGNLRELVAWGLLRPVVRKGERREYFEAEKDVWKMFCIIARERRRRELDPALEVLRGCVAKAEALPQNAEAAAFAAQLRDLMDFITTAGQVLDRVAASEQSKIVPLVIRAVGGGAAKP